MAKSTEPAGRKYRLTIVVHHANGRSYTRVSNREYRTLGAIRGVITREKGFAIRRGGDPGIFDIKVEYVEPADWKLHPDFGPTIDEIEVPDALLGH